MPEKVVKNNKMVGVQQANGTSTGKVEDGDAVNSPVEVTMELTERGLLQSAKQLYSNELAPLREAFQNASDSGASEFSVNVSRKAIIIRDNGKGMSYDFMKNEFNNIGARFKDSEGNIGQYGIGRLSFWAPIA